MANRERRPNESYENYRASLRNQQAADRLAAKGRLIFSSGKEPVSQINPKTGLEMRVLMPGRTFTYELGRR